MDSRVPDEVPCGVMKSYPDQTSPVAMVEPPKFPIKPIMPVPDVPRPAPQLFNIMSRRFDVFGCLDGLGNTEDEGNDGDD